MGSDGKRVQGNRGRKEPLLERKVANVLVKHGLVQTTSVGHKAVKVR